VLLLLLGLELSNPLLILLALPLSVFSVLDDTNLLDLNLAELFLEELLALSGTGSPFESLVCLFLKQKQVLLSCQGCFLLR